MWRDSAELQGSQSSSEADKSEATSASNGAAPKHVQNGNGRLPFDVSPGARPVPLVIKYHFAPFQFTFLVVISEVQPAHLAFYSTAFTQSTSTPLRNSLSHFGTFALQKRQRRLRSSSGTPQGPQDSFRLRKVPWLIMTGACGIKKAHQSIRSVHSAMRTPKITHHAIFCFWVQCIDVL